MSHLPFSATLPGRWRDPASVRVSLDDLLPPVKAVAECIGLEEAVAECIGLDVGVEELCQPMRDVLDKSGKPCASPIFLPSSLVATMLGWAAVVLRALAKRSADLDSEVDAHDEATEEVRDVLRCFTVRSSSGSMTVDAWEDESVAELLGRAARLAADCGLNMEAPVPVSLQASDLTEASVRGTSPLARLPRDTELLIGEQSDTDGHEAVDAVFLADPGIGPSVIIRQSGESSEQACTWTYECDDDLCA